MYTPRKDNSRADALSRRHNIARTKSITDTAILKVNNNRLLGLAKTLNLILRVTSEVLEELQDVIIKQYYNNPIYSYSSITRTIKLI